MKVIKQFQKKNNLIADGIIGKLTVSKMMEVWKLNEIEIVHFLAQTHHETAGFKYTEENLNYSPTALRRVFAKYFKQHEFTEFAYNPERIANRVYSNRMGNGDEKSGDGWAYRGRGSIQLTGKNNYERFGQKIKDMCILETPHIVADKYFWESGIFYFNEANIWVLCKDFKRDTIKKITRKINGGYNGLQDRINLTKHYERFV